MRPNVLVVEDEPEMQWLLHKVLVNNNCQVVCTDNGKNAIKLMREKLPNAVILDIRLPGMDGIEILRRIRRLNKRIGIIIITAYRTNQNFEEANTLGADRFISKPFDITQLMFTLQQLISEKACIDNLIGIETTFKNRFRGKRKKYEIFEIPTFSG